MELKYFFILDSASSSRGTCGHSLPDDAALVLVVSLHVEVTVVSDGKYVRRHLADLPVGVEADLVGSVNRQQLVGIDRHEDRACVRLQQHHKSRGSDVKSRNQASLSSSKTEYR